MGRAWSGHAIEDTCPCPQEPCGLIDVDRADEKCKEHGWYAFKTMRQGHKAEDCKGGNERQGNNQGD